VTPRATYRIQFGPSFGFGEAAGLAPYLSALGISHVYAAPVFAARPGSNHGYDVVDPSRLNPELGGEAGFRAMAAAFRRHGLRLILDIVPNHMGIGGEGNRYWLDVLRWGPQSRYARYFDIDWNHPDPRLAGKVLAPFLGESYRKALTMGSLELRFDPIEGGFAVWAHGAHKLPVCPRSYGRILRAGNCVELAAAADALSEAGPDDPGWASLGRLLAGSTAGLHAAARAFRGRRDDAASWDRLDALIGIQFWRPSKFSLASEVINYRRFFAINDLAGVRVEDPEVFEATHALILALIEEGLVEGLRVDHIDGLRDPKAYLQRLREQAPGLGYLLVEKILAPDEALPPQWDVDGTTGYEFANLLTGLQIDPVGEQHLARSYAAFTGHGASPTDVVREAKLEVMAGELNAELQALTRRLLALCELDLGRNTLATALAETVAALDVYRTYADADGMTSEDSRRIATAVQAARGRRPDLDAEAFEHLESALTLDLAASLPARRDACLELVLRAQQFTGPVMAKGLEDTVLYRFNRLIARNEVGSPPARPTVSVAEFHRANAERLAMTPRTMLATSTHDTKRGEDARARIAALTRHAPLWGEKVPEWHAMLADPFQPIDRNEEYFFYQLLLGAWPIEWRRSDEIAGGDLEVFEGRVAAAMLKSAREAAVNTRWTVGDAGYEAAFAAFIGRALAPQGRFLPSFRDFEAIVVADATEISLVQTVLKLTVPGVPDIYQGAELWEQSLVDPDNRRPVDFSRCAAFLDRPLSSAAATDPFAKFEVTRRLLKLRQSNPELFAEGRYQPLAVEGAEAEAVCAFARLHGDTGLVVAVPLYGARQRPGAESRITLPPRIGRSWSPVLTDALTVRGSVASFDRSHPVVMLTDDRLQRR
jgi:(1->4)-alpha-D-glucan 1-alpha-D-glucosylmutase